MSTKAKPNSTVARHEDGTIQITFTFAWEEIEKARLAGLIKMGESMQIPGFRKGKAPIEKVQSAVSADSLVQKTLEKLLPQALSEAIAKHNLKLAIMPRFELISAKEGEAWEIRGTTSELPTVELGDYQKAIKDVKPPDIWTPGKDKTKAELTTEQKEQIALKGLLDSTKCNISQALIDEEVNSRLSSLLERIEKLGLTLEGYLASVGKTPEGIREEYRKSAKESYTLDLALRKIAQEKEMKADPQGVEKLMSQATDSTNLGKDEQRRIVESILLKKSALEYLTTLV